MVSRKKRRNLAKRKARRAVKAAKEVAAVDESRQPDDLQSIGPPQQPAFEEEDEKEDNEKADGDNEEEVVGDGNKQQQTGGQELEKILMIDEATGQLMVCFSLGIMNGCYVPLDKDGVERAGIRLEEQIIEKRNADAKTCNHGCQLPGESSCHEFVETFDAAFMACRDAGEREYFSLFKAGVDATFIKYAHVWKDTKRIEWTKSFYMSRGVSILLRNGSDKRHALAYSFVACSFAQYILKDTEKAVACWPLPEDDLLKFDDFTTVSLFWECIPCACLDEKHEEAKLKKVAMEEKEMDPVDATFETDQLLFAPPNLLQKRIHSRKKKRIECPESTHALFLSPSGVTLRFFNTFTDYSNAPGGIINYNVRVAYLVTREEFAELWDCAAVIENISKIFLTLGTEYLLEGNNKVASHYAALVYCFEQHIACNLRKERLMMNWPKMNELYYDPDEHTLVSFFKKRITCSCLDTKYKQVRSVRKLGICYNIHCHRPDRKVVRSLTKCCSLCRRVNYCSRECQVHDWIVHKQYCSKYVEKDIAAVNNVD